MPLNHISVVWRPFCFIPLSGGIEGGASHRFSSLYSLRKAYQITHNTMQTRGTALVIDTISAAQPVISGQGATRTLNPLESGSVCMFDRAAGIVYTLPTAKPGAYFDFVVSTTVTSNAAKVITAAGTELLIGTLTSVDTDTSNAVAAFTGNGTDHIAISMNGTTTGAVAGTSFRVTCLSSTKWVVSGYVLGSGVVATPFATA